MAFAENLDFLMSFIIWMIGRFLLWSFLKYAIGYIDKNIPEIILIITPYNRRCVNKDSKIQRSKMKVDEATGIFVFLESQINILIIILWIQMRKLPIC